MTDEIQGVFDQQIKELEIKFDEETKALKEKKQLCKIIKSDVIDELEKEFDFKSFKKFKTEFNEFLDLLEYHIKTDSEGSEKSILEKISFIRNLKKW